MEGAAYANYAVEQDREAKLWEVWLSIYPYMNDENFISFEDFKEKAQGKRRQTDEDMLHIAMLLNAAYGGEVVEV